MFKSMKRIIKWAGKYKGRLYLGSVFSFSAACLRRSLQWLPLMPLIKQSQLMVGNTIESSLIWQTLWIIVGSIALNFLLSYCGGVAGKHWL